MITNFRQRSLAEKQIAEWHGVSLRIKSLVRTLSVDEAVALSQIESEIQNLRSLIAEYDDLVEGPFPHFEAVRQILILPRTVFSARIALGSVAQCAEQIGMHRQQLNRWEAQQYANITLSNLIELVEKFIPALELREEKLRERAAWIEARQDIRFDINAEVSRE